jgi:hypothetical protein
MTETGVILYCSVLWELYARWTKAIDDEASAEEVRALRDMCIEHVKTCEECRK